MEAREAESEFPHLSTKHKHGVIAHLPRDFSKVILPLSEKPGGQKNQTTLAWTGVDGVLRKSQKWR